MSDLACLFCSYSLSTQIWRAHTVRATPASMDMVVYIGVVVYIVVDAGVVVVVLSVVDVANVDVQSVVDDNT